MAFVNFATREITAKVVYYGPGLGGKTTSLQFIHNSLSPENRGKMISLATEEDRTIYFDFLPLHLGKIQDFAVRVQLYTVPGQVRYNATRKLVLRGADGLVFVADSQRHKKLANIESFNNLEENLREHGKDLKDLPHVLQFNKIDLQNLLRPGELNQLLNKYGVPYFETCATSGVGVLESLKSITKLVFNDLGRKALLQKKAKESKEEPQPSYSMDNAFVKKAAVVQTPSASTDYYVATDYKNSLLTGDQVGHDSDSSYMQSDEPFVAGDNKPRAEYSAFEKTPESYVPAVDPVDTIKSVEPVPELEEESFQGERMSLLEHGSDQNFSYQQLWDSAGKFANLMNALEKQIAENNTKPALQTARTAYSYLLTDLFPRDYILDGNETYIIFAMGVNFKRYLRFKHLLAVETATVQDLLYLHHFLCDLYLGLKEL